MNSGLFPKGVVSPNVRLHVLPCETVLRLSGRLQVLFGTRSVVKPTTALGEPLPDRWEHGIDHDATLKLPLRFPGQSLLQQLCGLPKVKVEVAHLFAQTQLKSVFGLDRDYRAGQLPDDMAGD